MWSNGEEKGKSILRFTLKFFFFWEMSCRDNIPPKRGKAMLESLDACHRN